MALTKVTGQVIKNTTDVTVGVLTVTNTLAVGGTVSIGGTLTYEDVTNIDSVGLITARNGIVVGSGITLSKDGDGFFTGVTTSTTFVGALTGNVTGNISGGTVAGSTGTFTGDVDIADKIVHTGDTDTAIRFPSADTITAETAGSARLRINSSGQIQIGGSTLINSDPLLTLGQSASTVGSQFHLVNDGSADLKQIFISAGKASRHVGIDVSTNNFFVGRDSVDSDLVLSSTGDMGLGTTSPLDLLELKNSTAQKKLVLSKSNSGTADQNGMWLQFNNYGPAATGRAADTIIGKIHFYASQPTSGNLQDAGAIECRADGTQTGNNTRSRLSFLTVDSQTATERLRITSSGETMIKGDDNPCLSVDRGSENTTNINILYNGSNRAQLSAATGGFELSAVGDIPMQFYTNGTEKARLLGGSMPIFKTGAVAVSDIWNSSGTGNEGAWLVAGGASQFAASNTVVGRWNRKSSNGAIIKFYYNGSEVGSISTNANSLPSDRNYKKNISDLNLGLSLVNKLKPSQFNFKVDEPNTPVMYGLIAQELEESLISEGVTKNSTQLIQHHPTDNDNESDYDVDYGKLTPVLINAIKELSTEIETLKAEVAALKS